MNIVPCSDGGYLNADHVIRWSIESIEQHNRDTGQRRTAHAIVAAMLMDAVPLPVAPRSIVQANEPQGMQLQFQPKHIQTLVEIYETRELAERALRNIMDALQRGDTRPLFGRKKSQPIPEAVAENGR